MQAFHRSRTYCDGSRSIRYVRKTGRFPLFGCLSLAIIAARKGRVLDDCHPYTHFENRQALPLRHKCLPANELRFSLGSAVAFGAPVAFVSCQIDYEVANLNQHSPRTVSYTHLTLPTKA